MPAPVGRPLRSGARGAALDALNVAIHNGGPAFGFIRHPNRNFQQTSMNFGGRLKGADFAPCMGGVDEGFDNSLAGSFVSALKRGLLHRLPWPNSKRVQGVTSERTGYSFNHRRRYSALGCIRRADHEQLGSKEWPGLDGQPFTKPRQQTMLDSR
jgi:hypothetical protein